MAEWFVSSAVLAALLIGAHYLLYGKISARLQYTLWLVPVSYTHLTLPTIA